MSERKKILLRLDPDVYNAIAKWAADDLRSVNAQIEFALRRALQSAGRAPRILPVESPEGVDSEPSAEGEGETGP